LHGKRAGMVHRFTNSVSSPMLVSGKETAYGRSR